VFGKNGGAKTGGGSAGKRPLSPEQPTSAAGSGGGASRSKAGAEEKELVDAIPTTRRSKRARVRTTKFEPGQNTQGEPDGPRSTSLPVAAGVRLYLGTHVIEMPTIRPAAKVRNNDGSLAVRQRVTLVFKQHDDLPDDAKSQPYPYNFVATVLFVQHFTLGCRPPSVFFHATFARGSPTILSGPAV
jgi:hypothetical protein